MFQEIKDYFRGKRDEPTVSSLLNFQMSKLDGYSVTDSDQGALKLHLPTPMLGYRGQKVKILVIGICQEFKRELVKPIPSTLPEFVEIFKYREKWKEGSDSNFDYITEFKRISYFKKIDWMLKKIFDGSSFQLGESSIYVDLIPYPTPHMWKDFYRYAHFTQYAHSRLIRLLGRVYPRSSDFFRKAGVNVYWKMGPYNQGRRLRERKVYRFQDSIDHPLHASFWK